MWQALGNRLAQRMLVSAPSVWGKLPDHGDFVGYRVTAQASQAWGEWVERHWGGRPDAAGAAIEARTVSRRELRDGPPRFTSLQVVRTPNSLREVPVVFILPPSAAAFSGGRFVQGVWVPSVDRSGRSCPLIVYQTVSERWMAACTLAELQLKPELGWPRQWLYWLARLSTLVHMARPDFNSICQTLDALWAPRAPGWRQLVGREPQLPSPHADEQALRTLDHNATPDPAQGLRGVAQLPWPDWPHSLMRTDQPLPVYWQHDLNGGYVNAAHSLEQLWEAHK